MWIQTYTVYGQRHSVIASPVGVNSKIIEPGRWILSHVNGDWENALSKVLGNPKFAYEMGRAGRSKIEKEYSLDVWALN